MAVDLEAARLMTYHSAWSSDTQRPTQSALAAMFRAKYFVGEAVSRITPLKRPRREREPAFCRALAPCA